MTNVYVNLSACLQPPTKLNFTFGLERNEQNERNFFYAKFFYAIFFYAKMSLRQNVSTPKSFYGTTRTHETNGRTNERTTNERTTNERANERSFVRFVRFVRFECEVKFRVAL